ncbi:MAG: DUF2155 domain-containing protein [Hyphomicrobiaceae bacterium]|nr:MAG: DUF2155 domain-containing protein [Hyphomicrobiaceae bacterium]
MKLLRAARKGLPGGHLALFAGLGCGLVSLAASADRVVNQVAVLAALDKTTARIERMELALGETKRFGALKITLRACYSRTPIETPKTAAFLEVREIKLDASERLIFSGWMFAESPGLNAVEHPVFDVWLTECVKPVLPARPTTTSQAQQPQEPRRTGQQPIIRQQAPQQLPPDPNATTRPRVRR